MPVPATREAFIKELFGDKAPDVLAKVNAKTDASKALSELIEYKDFSATSKPAPVTDEVTKSLGTLYSELVEETTMLTNYAKNLTQALAAKDAVIKALETKFDTETAAWQKALDEVLLLVNAAPKRASQDGKTLVSKDSALKPVDILSEDPVAKFFGVPMKPKV